MPREPRAAPERRRRTVVREYMARHLECIGRGSMPAASIEVNAEIVLGTRTVMENLLSTMHKFAHQMVREH